MAAADTEALVAHLHRIAMDLATQDFPTVPSPPQTSRRASVALILRINPSYTHWVPGTTSTKPPSSSPHNASTTEAQGQLAAFFMQDWVRHGTPEVLFIKRAARQGDRWTGHVALPGGRRDPGDADDRAAAVRETLEEVGLDLARDAIPAGNLPQRVVTTSWGQTPIMVLCPYVYLLTAPHAPLRLQPSEVAGAHWVPLPALLAPQLRTMEHQDVSGRLARADLGLQRWFYRGVLGKMRFSAIRLVPSSSTFSEPPVPVDAAAPDVAPPPPLNLWGLTLGVVADFLDLVPPHDAAGLWAYPTFGAPDVRFAIWALSAGFRARRAEAVRGGRAAGEATHDSRGVDDATRGNVDSIEIGAEAAISAKGSSRRPAAATPKSGIEGLDSGLGPSLRRHEFDAETFSTTLELYYGYVTAGIACALGVRTVALAGLGAWGVWRWRGR